MRRGLGTVTLSILPCILYLQIYHASVCLAAYPIASFPLVKPSSCSESEYFDSTNLRCRECGGSDADQRKFQRGTSEGLSCECRPQHRFAKGDKPGVKCQPCQTDEVTSFDGLNCVKCSQKRIENDTTVCLPCENGILVEKLENSKWQQQCVECPSSTWPDPSGKRCVQCPLDFQNASEGNCTCPSDKYVISGGSCLPILNLLPPTGAWSTISFDNGVKIKSAFFQEHLQAALYNCQVIKNITACNVLANLCVLSHYKLNSDKDDSTACDKYMEMTANTGHHEWPSNLTRLLYTENAKEILSKRNVNNKFTFNSVKNVSRLNLIAATYSINGTFLDLFPLTGSTLNLCGPVSHQSENGFVFGVEISHKCNLKVKRLWDNSKLFFYELFLLNYIEGKPFLYPVPVLIRNINKNGRFVNRGRDKLNWQLTRRFFLSDPITGIELEKENESRDVAKVFRYASRVSIRVTVQDDEDNVGAVYPPLLILDHAEVTVDDYKLNVPVWHHFSISYEMDQSDTLSNISISLGVISVLSLFYTVFQTWGWGKRSAKHQLDILIVFKFVIFACGNLADTFLLVILCAALNWLVMYKCQSIVHLLLPTKAQSKQLMLFISVAFAMKCVQLLDILIRQCSTNIFFIDWERPRSKTASSNVRRQSVKITDETAMGEGSSTASAGSISAAMGRTISRSSLTDRNNEISGASIWRVYFVASGWTELQTLRRVCPSLQLFITLFFLNVVGFETLALSDPFSNFNKEDSQRYTPYNLICRFVISVSIYLVVAFAQLMVHKVVYERFFEDKLQQFVDLCSVSNVSCFIMTMVKYGYYIHGRSTHGRADINMKEMHEHLRREEEDLCGNRGLLPNTEQQTFQMLLPEGVYEQYQRLLMPLRTYSQTSDRMQGAGGRLSRFDIDRVVNTYLMMNKFLSGFIDHAFKDLDYVIRDRLLLENILDVEFTEVTERGIFYNDNGHSFDGTLLCGQESTLIVFEVLLFAVIDSMSQNFVMAAVLTYFTTKVIQSIRKSVGRRNLVRKALIDERFLC